MAVYFGADSRERDLADIHELARRAGLEPAGTHAARSCIVVELAVAG